MFNKGIALGSLDRSEDEIVVYDEVIARFAEATELPLREQVARAMVNKGSTLGSLDRRTDAVAIYDEVIARFGAATEFPLREQLAKAMVNKALRSAR